MRTSLALTGALGLASALATIGPAVAASSVQTPLAPGEVVGTVTSYRVAKGDTLASIATHFAVNPVRVTGPNAEVLDKGLHTNQVIYVDQRRVRPRFAPWVSGVVLNIPEAQVYVVDHGALQKSYPAGVSMSDWKAPLGTTKVVLKEAHPTWHVPKSLQAEMARKGLEVKTQVPPGPKNPLGSRWVGFADGTYGFHGTTEPGSIKRYASHGCVRMLKADIEDLFDRVKVGTPVRIYYQPVLLAVDQKAVWLSVYPDIYGRHYDYRAAVKQLATTAGVADRVSWKAVEDAIAHKDGLFADVAVTSQPNPSPQPSP